MKHYCSKEISDKLFELGYNSMCDHVWCKVSRVKYNIDRKLHKKSGVEYLQLTDVCGGSLKFDDVFDTTLELLPYENRTDDYTFAIGTMAALEWLTYHDVRFTITPEKRKYSTCYSGKVWIEDQDVTVSIKKNSLDDFFNSVVIEGIKFLETKKDTK